MRGDCISVLMSRNEYPLHQHLFRWHYSFWHTFRHFRFGVQKVHTQLEFQRGCGVSINFVMGKESNSGEHSAVLAMDASFCSEVPCYAALTAAEKGKWNTAWAKSPVIKNSCSSWKKPKPNHTTFTKTRSPRQGKAAWLCPQHPADWAPFPSPPGKSRGVAVVSLQVGGSWWGLGNTPLMQQFRNSWIIFQ